MRAPTSRPCHIHLSCVPSDAGLLGLFDALDLYFETRAFLTRDLFGEHPNYSWRAINRCDALIVATGTTYGTPNASGVSQLHVSFLNAKTRDKPILALIKKTANPDRRLRDFVDILKASVPYLEFDKETDLMVLLDEAYRALDLNAPDTLALEMPKKPTRVLALDDTVRLTATAHAFLGGTLFETSFEKALPWRVLVDALKRQDAPFSLSGIMRIINSELALYALDLVNIQNPQVHAVSRVQVLRIDALFVLETLKEAGLINSVLSSSRIDEGLWRLTDALN